MQLPDFDLTTYVESLEHDYKLKLLGEGVFATVFQHPVYVNMAVKIFNYNDYSYQLFLEWCLKNQHNKFVPKIQSIEHRESSSGEKISLVFMEKLTKISTSRFNSFLNSVNKLAGVSAFYDFEDYDEHHWQRVARRAEDPDLKSIARRMAKFLPNDLHSGNIMKRRNGQLVFTDPYVD